MTLVCVHFFFSISLQRTRVLWITLIVNLLLLFFSPLSKGPWPTLEVGGNERKYRASLKFLFLSLICRVEAAVTLQEN